MEKKYTLFNPGTRTYHIYECSEEGDSCNTTYYIPKGAKPMCNDNKVDAITKNITVKEVYNENDIRIKCANLHNNGEYVCGNCVKRFYAN